MRSATGNLLTRAGLRYQSRHRWQAALALIGIVMGVAVVMAVDLANRAAKASFLLSAEQLQGKATHRLLSASNRLPQSLYSRLFTTPGHPPMAPVIQTRVRVAGRPAPLTLLGVDLFAEGAFRNDLSSLTQGQAAASDWLTSDKAVALSRSAARALNVSTGDALEISAQGVVHRLQVRAVGSDDHAASRDLLITDIATAQAIGKLGNDLSHVDLILSDESRTWLEQRLPPDIELVDIQQQTAGTAGLSAAFELNLTAMSLLALLVGIFLIFNAMSFSVVQRRRLLGRLRAIGVRSDEIARLVMTEALVLGAIGTLIGLLVGTWLGQGLTRIVAATVSELYYSVSVDALHIELLSVAKAVALGLGGTLLATWLPARQAAATPPLTTLSRAALEQSTQRQVPVLATLGAALIIVGLAIAFSGLGLIAGFAGLFVLLIGAAMLSPLAVRLTHRVLVRLPLRGIWRMAIRDIDRHLSRLGTAVAALMVALAASVGVAIMVDSMRGAVSDWLGNLLTADLYVASDDFRDGATLSSGVIERVATVAAVNATSRYRHRRIRLDGHRVELSGAELAPASRRGFTLLSSVAGSAWEAFDNGGILVSEPLAHRLGLTPGQQIELPTPAGNAAFSIAAVFRDFGSEHGRIFMPLPVYRSAWQDDAINTLALFTEASDKATLRDQVAAALTDIDGIALTAAGDIFDESMAVFDRTFRITDVLRYLSLGVAFIGVLTALMALQLERRKEYAVVRALGLTRLQLSGLIAIQSATLGLIAALMSLPIGMLMAWVLTDSIQVNAFGWSMPFLLDPAPLAITVVLGIGAALIASIYPAWEAGNQPPAVQLRED